MPVPRRFDRRPPDRDPTRINERIRVPKVRLIGADGSQIGIVETDEARRIAREADLDQVEIGLAGNATGLVGVDDADLGAVGADQADLRNADALVDPGGVPVRGTPVETSRDRH